MTNAIFRVINEHGNDLFSESKSQDGKRRVERLRTSSMPKVSRFNRHRLIIMISLIGLLWAVSYGVATLQTPYGCGSADGAITLQKPPQGPDINLQVLLDPCFYVYFVGIVGGSILVIFLIPIPEKTVVSSKLIP